MKLSGLSLVLPALVNANATASEFGHGIISTINTGRSLRGKQLQTLKELGSNKFHGKSESYNAVGRKLNSDRNTKVDMDSNGRRDDENNSFRERLKRQKCKAELQDDVFETRTNTLITVFPSDILGNDAAKPELGLVIESYTAPSSGEVTQNLDGGFSYEPFHDFEGVDSFQYVASDNNGGADTANIFIVVGYGGDITPVLTADEFSTLVNTPLTIKAMQIRENDVGKDAKYSAITGYSTPSNGVLKKNPDGGFTYKPNSDFFGNDNFTYFVSDIDAGIFFASITITVDAANRAPIAVDDMYIIPANADFTMLNPSILDNDHDADGDILTLKNYTSPTDGSLVNDGGSFKYIPGSGFNGVDTFDYTVSDGNGGESTASVTIIGEEVNRSPTVVDNVFSTPQNTELVIMPTVLFDGTSDTDVENMVLVNVTAPENGELTRNADGGFTYMPANGYYGVESFSYTVRSKSGIYTTDSFIISVVAFPIAMDDTYITCQYTQLIIPSPGILENDSAVDGLLFVRSHTKPENGDIEMNAVGGGFMYMPFDNFSGSDSFLYVVVEDKGGSDFATVTITVAAHPVAKKDDYITYENKRLTPFPGILENDCASNGNLFVSSHTEPVNGRLELSADGYFTYTPAINFTGVDTFDYIVGDNKKLSNTATVTIRVLARPFASDDQYIVSKQMQLSIPSPGILENDSVSNGPLLVRSYTEPINGFLELNVDGGFNYTPGSNFTGIDMFDYVLVDNRGEIDTAKVIITVVDIPMAIHNTFTICENTHLDISNGFIPKHSYVDPDSGLLQMGIDSGIRYTPNANFTGSDQFEYAVAGAQGGNSNASAIVTVVSSLYLMNDTYTTFKNRQLDVSSPGILANDCAASEYVLVRIHTEPYSGILQLDVKGGFTYTPRPNFVGIDMFEYIVYDNQDKNETAAVIITVIAETPPTLPLIITEGIEQIGGKYVVGTSSDCELNFSNCTGVNTVEEMKDSDIEGNGAASKDISDYTHEYSGNFD